MVSSFLRSGLLLGAAALLSVGVSAPAQAQSANGVDRICRQLGQAANKSDFINRLPNPMLALTCATPEFEAQYGPVPVAVVADVFEQAVATFEAQGQSEIEKVQIQAAFDSVSQEVKTAVFTQLVEAGVFDFDTSCIAEASPFGYCVAPGRRRARS